MGDLATFTAVGLMALTLYVGQNLVRYLRAKDWNGVLGIVLAWLLGLGVATLGAHSNVTDGLVLIKSGPSLGQLDGGALILLGVGLGSLGSGIADYRNARDNSTSAAKPDLVPPTLSLPATKPVKTAPKP